MRALIVLAVLGLIPASAAARKKSVASECRSLRLMRYMSLIDKAGLSITERNAISALRIAVCLGGTTLVPQTRNWPNGKTGKDAHGTWYYPNGQALLSTYRAVLYPNGKTARTHLGEWNYPDGTKALRKGVVETWYKPGGGDGMTLARLLHWATTRLAPEDFKEIDRAKHLRDRRVHIAAILLVILNASRNKPRK